MKARARHRLQTGAAEKPQVRGVFGRAWFLAVAFRSAPPAARSRRAERRAA
jgi:hypothetical protein